MATKKTTTRGKTKTTTTKSRAASTKTAKPATKSAKTAKKPVVKKNGRTTVKVSQTAASRPSLFTRLLAGRRSTAVATTDSANRLSRLHWLSALTYIVLAAVAGSVMSTASYSLSLGHMGRDTLASSSTTVYAPASEPFFDLEIRWALVAILAVAAIFSVLYITRLKAQYQNAITTRVSKWRWIEIGITSALVVELLAVLSGVDDIAALKLIGGLMAISAVMGWLVERATIEKRATRAALFTGVFASLLPVLLIAMYAVSTYIYGGIRSPWYVYASYAIAAVSGWLISRNLRRSITGTDYAVTEYNYVATGLLTKAALALVLIIGLQR